MGQVLGPCRAGSDVGVSGLRAVPALARRASWTSLTTAGAQLSCDLPIILRPDGDAGAWERRRPCLPVGRGVPYREEPSVQGLPKRSS